MDYALPRSRFVVEMHPRLLPVAERWNMDWRQSLNFIGKFELLHFSFPRKIVQHHIVTVIACYSIYISSCFLYCQSSTLRRHWLINDLLLIDQFSNHFFQHTDKHRPVIFGYYRPRWIRTRINYQSCWRIQTNAFCKLLSFRLCKSCNCLQAPSRP